MRISDWSSDVCSSDLRWRYRRQVDRTDRPRHGDSPIWKMRSFRTNYQGASARDTADRLYARNRPKRLCTFARLSMRRIVTKDPSRSNEHTSERQTLMRISYAFFCLTNKCNQIYHPYNGPPSYD